MKYSHTIQNIPDWITSLLREDILNNVIKAGEPLRQQELSKRFEVSMIPVREALRKLESEGLVEVIPNRGAYVSALSIEKIQEIFETRILLEVGALERAFPHMTDGLLAQADHLLDQLDQTTDGGELSQLNQEFHALLLSPINNVFLLNLIRSLHLNIERYMRLYLLDQAHHQSSQLCHRQIMSALHNKNIKEAKKLLAHHMRGALSNLTSSMETAG